MRLGAQEIGGYYKTPTHLLAPIARLLTVGTGEAWSVVDPCAADGEAVLGIVDALWPAGSRGVEVYACEMEATRYEALKAKQYRANGAKLTAEHGDAMALMWDLAERHGSPKPGASLFYGNYPYDYLGQAAHDRELKRLEERFARRFVHCLCDQGVYIDVRPYYSLSASADTFARNLTDLRCYRFPDPDYDVFKQVVLVGVKRPTLDAPDPAVRSQVMAWSGSVDGMPVLGTDSHVYTIPGHASYHTGFSSWRMAPLDVRGLLARVRPWHSTDRGGRPLALSGVVPPPGDSLARRYPLATPPKPAHLAAAIASGVFNGAEVTSTAGRRLRVKGVFTKDFVKAEDKTNKDGEKTGEVRIQQPVLSVTVLDCATGQYHTLKSTAESSGSTDPATMTTGDLLTQYGRELMRVMLEQCPVLHDPANPAHEIELPPLARRLYRAQAHAVMALVKLISPEFAELRRAWDPRRNGEPENGLLLGQVGVGKSSVADAVYEYMRVHGYASNALIMCPPHLLQSWADQVKAVTPHNRTAFLESVADVDAMTNDGVYVLSRETAKLSHAFAGVSGTACPKCGAPLPVASDGIRMAPEELARKRVRCESRATQPANEVARIADDLALALMLVCPHSADVNQRCRGRMRDRLMLAKVEKIAKAYEGKGENVFRYDRAAWDRARPAVAAVLDRLALRMLAGDTGLEQPMLGLVAGLSDDPVTASLCERLYGASALDDTTDRIRDFVRDALLLHKADRMPLVARLKSLGLDVARWHGAPDPWDGWAKRANAETDPESYRTGFAVIDGARVWHKRRIGSPSCVVAALALLGALSERTAGKRCGEPLYQAIPEPRRVALAKYLTQRGQTPGLFILDEAHEAAGETTAQGLAARRVMGTRVPTVELTGSVMNGYAVSLYAMAQARDPIFREEFPRRTRTDGEDKQESTSGLREFNRRYGYIKVLAQETDKEGKVVEWGSQSERRETVKEIGNAPGVLPLFLLKYLLRTAVPLQMSDLAIDLAPHREIVEYVQPNEELGAECRRLLKNLQEQIKQDRFSKDLAGKLFGQMSEIGSYLDRATRDTGNCASGDYELRYPDSPEAWGGSLVASAKGLDPAVVLPKERWMLDLCRREFAEGRRVMIFGWHEAVLPRLARLIEVEFKEPCALLLSKVQAKKRQDWIDREVIAKKRRVVVLNPACVKTGLNNLVWFQSCVWMENPAVDPQTYRQATGRINRIGKTAESRAYFPVYEGTVQALAHRLLLTKVSVSMATDGLDPESALQAAGVGSTEALDAFSVGRALFEMLERGEEQARPKAPRRLPPPPSAAPANDTGKRVANKRGQYSLF